MKSLGAFVGLLAVTCSAAHAQVTSPATERYYLNVNAGIALPAGEVSGLVSRELYDETAAVAFSIPRAVSWLADVTGGVRLGGDIYLGLSVAHMATRSDGSYEASIPDPVFFNRPLRVNSSLEGFDHRATIVSPHVTWSAALTDNFDITTAVGLAIARVAQDVASELSVTPGTQLFTLFSSEERAIAVGPFLNVDLIRNLRPRFGIGGFVRYAGATASLPSVKLKVGGFQGGGGLRLRF